MHLPVCASLNYLLTTVTMGHAAVSAQHMTSRTFMFIVQLILKCIVRRAMCNARGRRRDVMALEETFLRMLREVDPVFEWSRAALDPARFLHLDDSILHQLRSKDPAELPAALRPRAAEGRRVLHLMDTGRGARFIPEARCLPAEAVGGRRTPALKQLVRAPLPQGSAGRARVQVLLQCGRSAVSSA